MDQYTRFSAYEIAHIHNRSNTYHITRQVMLNNIDCFFYHILTLGSSSFNAIYNTFACMIAKSSVEVDVYMNVNCNELDYIIEYIQTNKINMATKHDLNFIKNMVDLTIILKIQKLTEELKKCLPQKETVEEHKNRAQLLYNKLQLLVQTHNIILTKQYTPEDDPNLMQQEYDTHIKQIQKIDGINFYKKTILNLVLGFEILNKKYNVIDFQLDGWANHLIENMDDSLIEKLYETYPVKNLSLDDSPLLMLFAFMIKNAAHYHITQKFTNTNTQEPI